jgi:DNA-binding winged helix-turn-helix (wHTH) protein
METAAQLKHSVRFRNFELNLLTRELHRNGRLIKLRGHPIEVLAILLERHGELVTREELQKKLWPRGTFVDFEQILNNSIRMLREALGDKAEAPQYIETLPRLGYRFIARVETTAVDAAAPAPTVTEEGRLSAPPESSVPSVPSKRWMAWVAAGVFAAILGGGTWVYLHLPLPPPAN